MIIMGWITQLGILVALFFLVAALLMWMWNRTIPEITPLKSMTYWQAFRLLVIASILFGNPLIGVNLPISL